MHPGSGVASEPMPAQIVPMLAKLAPLPARQSDYAFEYMWDGVRALCYFDGDILRLESRNRRDITARYPELQPLREALRGRRAVLDGEIVALDERGRISFGLLQARMHLENEAAIAALAEQSPVVYMLFDLLYLDARSTMQLEYEERRALFEHLRLEGECWRTPPYHVGAGSAMLEVGRQHAIEGIVAKRLGSLYEPGRRSGAWRKTRLLQRQEFVIGGWLPEKGRRAVGALLVGYYPEPGRARATARLRYAGEVGTGVAEGDRVRLTARLRERARETTPFDHGSAVPQARYVRPELVAEIEFRGWTHHGTLRQPSFKGLRTDKDPRQVVRETLEAPHEAKEGAS